MDPYSSWLYIVIIVVLVFLAGTFSATETSFACLNQFKMRVLAEEGNKTAKRVINRYEKFELTLVTSLVGYNAVSIFVSTISTFLFQQIFNNVISDELISLITTIIMTIIVYLFCDTIPKLIARAIPNRVAMILIYPSLFFYYLLWPAIMFFSLITKLVNKIMKTEDKPTMTEEDFTNVVESIEEDGQIESNESDIIYNSLDFTDTTVYEVLTKKDKMFTIDLKDITREKLHNIILNSTYTRIPVCYGSVDKIVGILHVKNYIKAYLKNPNVPILSTLQKPYIVTPKIKADDMIEGFKKHKTHIAIVMFDKKVLGMVTMEDILEELVGDIHEDNILKRRGNK